MPYEDHNSNPTVLDVVEVFPDDRFRCVVQLAFRIERNVDDLVIVWTERNGGTVFGDAADDLESNLVLHAAKRCV